MNRLVRYWNQNRKKIIVTVAIIACIIILINMVNAILRNSEEKSKSILAIDKSKPIESVITGESVSEEKTDENTGVIKQFIDYCNNKEYENAYSLLTEACKKEFNNDKNVFIKNYCENVFKTAKTYNLELWFNSGNMYTYKIKLYNDNLLATGSISMDKNIEDYITIIKENNESKININGFITEKEVNKSQRVGNIEIVVNSRKIYKSYETYSITIRNYSDKTILINEGQNEKDICLIDNNEVKYSSFIEELPIENLLLKSGYQKNINIKFNKMYDVYRIIDKIEFNNIISDYDYHINNPNLEDIQKVKIQIEI